MTGLLSLIGGIADAVDDNGKPSWLTQAGYALHPQDAYYAAETQKQNLANQLQQSDLSTLAQISQSGEKDPIKVQALLALHNPAYLNPAVTASQNATEQQNQMTRARPGMQRIDLDNQVMRSSLAALANAQKNGVTDPIQLGKALAAVNPDFVEKAATIQAQNPLGTILQNSGQSAPTQGLSGDELLKALPQSLANQVKAISEGRQQPPNSFALRSPYGQQLMALVSQYDPSFDIANPAKRLQTAKSFAPGGKDRQNLNSIETAMNTLAQLQEANEKLGGGQYGNSIRNAALDQQSDPDLRIYKTLAKTAADEVTRAVIGGTGGTGEDRKTREGAFSHNQSPEARKAAITAAIGELKARLDPVAAAYTSGMGTTKEGIELLTPKAQAAYKKIMGVEPDQVRTEGNPSKGAAPLSHLSTEQLLALKKKK